MRPGALEMMPSARPQQHPQHGWMDGFTSLFYSCCRVLCCLGVERPLDALDSSTADSNSLLHYQAPSPAVVQGAHTSEPDTPSSDPGEQLRLLPKGHASSAHGPAPPVSASRGDDEKTGTKPTKLASEFEAQRARVREKLGAGLSLADLDEDVCPTCLDPYTEENPRITTSCEHHFHLACIYEWLERSQTCPMCGTSMRFSELL